MSSKQQRAVKGTEPEVSRNEGWNVLSWDDLTEWAGSRSVERGRAYQRQGRVHDLAISENGWLLATVRGGERYAVTVWCEQLAKKGGTLYSRCTCPVGASGCKHAVAVVAEYLERLGAGAENPVTNQDDERWEMLADESGEEDDDDEADDLDVDSDDHVNEEIFYVHRRRHPGATGRRTLKASDKKIRKYIEDKSREELVDLVWSLTERFPELREEFSDRIALGEGILHAGTGIDAIDDPGSPVDGLPIALRKWRNRSALAVIDGQGLQDFVDPILPGLAKQAERTLPIARSGRFRNLRSLLSS